MRFEVYEITWLRAARKRGASMALMCQSAMKRGHDRDAIVEALDAIVRFGDDRAACARVNDVLHMQDQGAPLINGREQWKAAPYLPAFISPAAMF